MSIIQKLKARFSKKNEPIMKETFRVFVKKTHLETHLRIRYVPQVIAHRFQFLGIKLFPVWASFQTDEGEDREFPNPKKAMQWLKREVRREYRDHTGPIKIV